MELLLSMRPAAVIDLDVTFFIQLVVFLVVLVALRFLIFKPMLALLEARRAETEGKEETARKDALEAEALGTRYRGVMSDAAAEGMQLRNQKRDAALRAESELLSKARADAAKWLEEEVDKQRQAMNAARANAAPVVEAVAQEVVRTLTAPGVSAQGGGRA